MASRIPAVALLAIALPTLSGCLVRTAANVATFPVRAGSYAVDKATTSQSEADRNRGRRERKAEEKQAREQRKAQKEAAKQEREGNGY